MRNKILNYYKILGAEFDRKCSLDLVEMNYKVGVMEMSLDFNPPKEDFKKIYQMLDQVDSQVKVTPHLLWNIPIKTHNKEEYDSGELTE